MIRLWKKYVEFLGGYAHLGTYSVLAAVLVAAVGGWRLGVLSFLVSALVQSGHSQARHREQWIAHELVELGLIVAVCISTLLITATSKKPAAFIVLGCVVGFETLLHEAQQHKGDRPGKRYGLCRVLGYMFLVIGTTSVWVLSNFQ